MLRKVKFYRLLRVCGVGSAARKKEQDALHKYHPIRMLDSFFIIIIAYKGKYDGQREGQIFAFFFYFALNCECECKCQDATLLS